MKGFDRVFGCFGRCVGTGGVSYSCDGLEEGFYLDFMWFTKGQSDGRNDMAVCRALDSHISESILSSGLVFRLALDLKNRISVPIQK